MRIIIDQHQTRRELNSFVRLQGSHEDLLFLAETIRKIAEANPGHGYHWVDVRPDGDATSLDHLADHPPIGWNATNWPDFQESVARWMQVCFGPEIAGDKIERNHRFLEEALETVQALGCTRAEAHNLVEYVFNRPTGEPAQEVGGVMVTLAALCLASGLSMEQAGEAELVRVWQKIHEIRAKQAAKPKHSALPA